MLSGEEACILRVPWQYHGRRFEECRAGTGILEEQLKGPFAFAATPSRERSEGFCAEAGRQLRDFLEP